MDSTNLFSKFFNYFSNSSDFKRKEENFFDQKETIFKDSIRSSHNKMSSKSKKLHDSHKMSPKEENWFNVDPNQYPYWPNYQHFYPKSSSLPCFQSVYNINKGCYEDLPISVRTEEFSQNQKDYNNQEDFSVAEEHQSYFQENMGHIYNNLMNFVEISLVQSVCQRSQLENNQQNRMAAEILEENSGLKRPFGYNQQNRMAAEILAASDTTMHNGKVNKCWVAKCLEYNQQNRMAAEILAASSLNPNAKEFTPANFHSEEHLDEEKTMVQLDGSSELIENDESPQFVNDAILIEDKNESLAIHDNNAGDKTICDNEDDEEDWDEDEDDWDWDSDEEHASVQCVDLAEFEDLFQVNLLVTNLGSCHPSPPSCSSSNPQLREINQRFLKSYPNSCCERSEPNRVKFSDNPVVILEPESLAEDLQEARINSEFIRRKADKERNERLLAPILTQKHRQNIFQKIYGENP